MNIHLEFNNGTRVVHAFLDNKEAMELKALLDRALNTHQNPPPWSHAFLALLERVKDEASSVR
jgi:hypothetical protein